jgi:hypothetical protein
MQTTRRTAVAIGLAVACATGLSAQTQETKTTTNTKIEVKGGKDVSVIGCLERRPSGNYILTDVAHESRRTDPSRYALLTSEDLSKHVGERVEIRGKAVVNGDGKVSVESKTKTEVEKRQGSGNQDQNGRHERHVRHASDRHDVDEDPFLILQLTALERARSARSLD